MPDCRLGLEGGPVGFWSGLLGAEGLYTISPAGTGPPAAFPLVVTDPEGELLTVTVKRDGRELACEEIRLFPGQDRDVEIAVRVSLERTSGVVVDPEGRPVAGADVFLGDLRVLDGAEPVGPPKWRSRPSARTDADGRFVLRGEGSWVSALHDELSPCTVAREETVRLVLGPTGAIAVYGAEEAVLVEEDRIPVVASGGLWFERVPAGFHLLQAGGGVLHAGGGTGVGFRVRPGETATVDLSGALDEVRIELRSGGETWDRPLAAILIGDAGTSTFGGGLPSGGVLRLQRVLPGSYLLLFLGGPIVPVVLENATEVAEVGTATLTVVGRPGQRVALLPASRDELFLRGLATLLAMPVPGGGRFAIGPLLRGRYVAFPPSTAGSGAGLEETIEVDGPDAVLTLPPSWPD